ncbi:MAG: TPM domain-containing protein [Beijerinckiaceae bacterium]
MRFIHLSRTIACTVCVWIIAVCAVATAQTFPPLTGRVVDQANVLSPEAEMALDQKLKAHEDKTSDQIVVATIRSLEGYDIADYANRLFRSWKLGQAKTNNGVLVLVAPNDRKIRVEVGYGLEGSLTDAVSRVIIAGAIAPKFKQNDYGGGLNAGVDAIIGTLTGDDEWQQRAKMRNADEGSEAFPLLLVVVIIILVFFILPNFFAAVSAAQSGQSKKYHRKRNGQWIVLPGPSSWGGGGGGSWGGSGGGFGGGFSGGGGSSGGGGASGDW